MWKKFSAQPTEIGLVVQFSSVVSLWTRLYNMTWIETFSAESRVV